MGKQDLAVRKFSPAIVCFDSEDKSDSSCREGGHHRSFTHSSLAAPLIRGGEHAFPTRLPTMHSGNWSLRSHNSLGKLTEQRVTKRISGKRRVAHRLKLPVPNQIILTHHREQGTLRENPLWQRNPSWQREEELLLLLLSLLTLEAQRGCNSRPS